MVDTKTQTDKHKIEDEVAVIEQQTDRADAPAIGHRTSLHHRAFGSLCVLEANVFKLYYM